MKSIIKTKKTFIDYLLSKGAHLGYTDWKTSFLYVGKSNNLSIFQADQIISSITRVCSIFQHISLSKKPIQLLIVNTNPEYNQLVKTFAANMEQNYVNNRWVGGTLTNWEKISQGIFKFQRLSVKFPMFQSKNPRYVKMKKSFNGITNYSLKPDIILLTNANLQKKILQEAHLLQIPVIAFVDSNTDQQLITYPIYGNAASFEFVYFCLDLFLQIYNKNKEL